MTTKPPVPARRATAQQVALDHIRELISGGFLAPDDHIRQEQLAAELGTSVIPVREALKTLEAEGLVRYAPHRGYQVARLSIDELRETYLMRQLLEDEIVRTAAPLLEAGDFDELDALMDQMDEASSRGDAAAMIEANRAFHFHIYAAAGRPRMVEFIRVLWQTTDAYRSVYYTNDQARERVNAEHRSIVAALRAGDVERAVAEFGRHRGHAVEALEQRLD